MLSAVCVCLLLSASSAARLRQPDTDNLVKELHDNANYKNAAAKPTTDLSKTFSMMDFNGDGQLETQELMFHQFATGCEPQEGQVRANDYMRCGDADKNGMISAQEFNASTQPAWAECIKQSSLRRSHGFIKFFDADQNLDGNLTRKELEVGVLQLWGQAGEELGDNLLKCADKNKDGMLQQSEFHSAIAAYNPATRKWTMWNGTSDQGIIKCMEPAYAKFDSALVFYAVDTNKDHRISEQEEYNLFGHLGGWSTGTMKSTTADKIFWAADKDKDGFLNLEEFENAGEAYKGKNEATDVPPASFFQSAKWNPDTYDEGMGMSLRCASREQGEWRIFSEDLGRVKVVPKLCPGGGEGKPGKPCWDGSVKVQQR